MLLVLTVDYLGRPGRIVPGTGRGSASDAPLASEFAWMAERDSVLWVFVGGLAFVAAGGVGMYQDRRLHTTGKRVPGIVVDHHWESSGKDGGRSCFPVVEFRTVDGRVVRAKTRVGGSPIAGVGEQVPVLYAPDNPENLRIDTWAGRATWMSVVAIVLGLGLIAWSVYHGEV